MATQSGLYFGLSAHELAHQWFGDDITCASWEDIWLNEGFATFLNGLSNEYLRSYDTYISYWENAQSYIFTAPGGSVFVEDTTNTSRIFDQRLSYNKGAYLLRMLRWNLGDDIFFQACRNYLQDASLKFSYAKTRDFQNHLERVSGQDLSAFFDHWFYGEGYPKVGVQWAATGEDVILKFSQTPSHPSVDFYDLKIPLRLIGMEADTTMLIHFLMEGQRSVLSPGFEVSEVLVDPEFKLLMEKKVVRDQSLTDELGKIILMPNPASSTLTVSILESGFKPYEYRIYASDGSLKLTGNINMDTGFSQTIDITHLNAGYYILELNGKSRTRTESFVKY